jgi:hypothetical protein
MKSRAGTVVAVCCVLFEYVLKVRHLFIHPFVHVCVLCAACGSTVLLARRVSVVYV